MISAAQEQIIPVRLVIATVMRVAYTLGIAAETSTSSTAHATKVGASNHPSCCW